MKLLPALLLLLAAAARAQTAGTVTQTALTTVTATAGAIVCVFTNPARPTIHTACAQSGATVLTMDATPATGSTSGAVGSINLAGNSVTWIIQQPTANAITWQIAANGTSASGTF